MGSCSEGDRFRVALEPNDAAGPSRSSGGLAARSRADDENDRQPGKRLLQQGIDESIQILGDRDAVIDAALPLRWLPLSRMYGCRFAAPRRRRRMSLQRSQPSWPASSTLPIACCARWTRTARRRCPAERPGRPARGARAREALCVPALAGRCPEVPPVRRSSVPVEPAPQIPGLRKRARIDPSAERDFPRDLPVAIRPARRIRNVRRPAELRAIHFHHVEQHLLAGFQAEPEERGARVGENVEERQRELYRRERWGGRFPARGSCASLLHRRLPSLVVVTPVLPLDGWKEPPLFFSVDQFNSRRDIPQDGSVVGISRRVDVTESYRTCAPFPGMSRSLLN